MDRRFVIGAWLALLLELLWLAHRHYHWPSHAPRANAFAPAGPSQGLVTSDNCFIGTHKGTSVCHPDGWCYCYTVEDHGAQGEYIYFNASWGPPPPGFKPPSDDDRRVLSPPAPPMLAK